MCICGGLRVRKEEELERNLDCSRAVWMVTLERKEEKKEKSLYINIYIYIYTHTNTYKLFLVLVVIGFLLVLGLVVWLVK